MKIIDMNGNEITSPDLALGYLKEEQVFVAHHDATEAVKEIGHYEVVNTYSKGRDVKWVVDVPGAETKEAWDEYETVQRYIPYTEEELNAPKPLSIEERIAALEKVVEPAVYVAGTWYRRGNKVTFEGNVYTCVAPEGMVCTWSPAEYPTYWAS